LTTAERAARNARIAEARAAGEPWATIAEREGLSVKQARRCRDEHLRTAGAPPPSLDADALVERVLRGHLVALDRLEALAADADADSARVGAARSLSTVGVNLIGLLARLGRLGDPGLLRFQAEIRLAVDAIYGLADRYEIPPEEVLATVEGMPLERAGLVVG
jgi:hypothetical protein